MEKQQLIAPSRQCSSTPVGFDQGFLTKEQCDNTGASPILSDLAAADFHLYSRLKSALKGRRFCGASDVIKNATEELKRLSQNGSHACSRQLYSRWQKCVTAEWAF
jgi:hypothetical protein